MATDTDTTKQVGTYHFVTESYLVDFQGMVPISLMLDNYLLYAATEHAETRGFGYKAMTEKNLTWVLSRIDMKIKSYPRMTEAISVQTWVEDVGRLFTTRCFAMFDKKDEAIAYARSTWAAIDLNTRRPTDLLSMESLQQFVCKGKECPIEKGKKIPPAEDVQGIPYRVRYSDLDVNRHLNSVKYIEHILDLFDIEKFKSQKISRFEIVYLAEGKYGMELSLHLKELEPSTKYAAAICDSSGKAICRAMVVWE